MIDIQALSLLKAENTLTDSNKNENERRKKAMANENKKKNSLSYLDHSLGAFHFPVD